MVDFKQKRKSQEYKKTYGESWLKEANKLKTAFQWWVIS
jgi:hypothetical protein